MNYRCLTCGFVQDFVPTRDSANIHHPWMEEYDHTWCPSCVKYLLKHGGRRNDNPNMPDIDEPGILVDEAGILSELSDLNADFFELQTASETSKKHKDLVKKYKNKKLFGFSPDDIKKIRARIAEKEARRAARA